MRSRKLAIDFDGVINSYTSGYMPGDDGWLPDPPVEGALEFVKEAVEIFDQVFIFTTRARSAAGVDAVKEWLHKYGFPDMTVTNMKEWATVYLDDRGYTFSGKFPSAKSLFEFKSWMEKKGE